MGTKFMRNDYEVTLRSYIYGKIKQTGYFRKNIGNTALVAINKRPSVSDFSGFLYNTDI